MKRFGMVTLLAAALTVTLSLQPAEAQPLGDEFQVNSYTTDSQYEPDVASDAAGNFVVVWVTEESSGNDTYSTSIAGQRYDASRAPVGGEFQVNTYTTGGQFRTRVAMNSSGAFVVVWDGPRAGDDNADIVARRFASSGTALGDDFLVNTYTTHTQRYPAVDLDADGDFVISFTSYGSASDDCCGYPFSDSAQARRFASSGSPLGDQFQVNTYITGFQGSTAVASAANGDFVVVWDSGKDAVDTSYYSVQGQRYTSNGSESGSQFLVNTYTTYSQGLPSIASDAAGNFVVVWQGYGLGADPGGSIQGQRFSATILAAVGGEFQVNSYSPGYPNSPGIAMSDAGEFVVTWYLNNYSPGNDTSYAVLARDFSASALPVNPDFQVNAYTTSYQYRSRAAIDSDGNFVVVWMSYGSSGTDSSSYSVQGQLFGTQILFADGFESGDTSAWQ